jgi:hypothetical protein
VKRFASSGVSLALEIPDYAVRFEKADDHRSLGLR